MKIKKIYQIDWKKLFFSILRMIIGWHFLYEGVLKLIIPNWSSYSYLAYSTGPFSSLYHWIASSPSVLKVVDILNLYGLIFIGIALFIGLFSRFAALAGSVLLILYYFAYPPFGTSLLNTGEGHLFIVDKIFIEAAILSFFIFYKEKGFGIDLLVELLKKSKAESKSEKKEDISFSDSRREVLKNIMALPILSFMGWWASRTNIKYNIDAISGATIQLNQAALRDLNGILPKGKIGDHEISSMVLGGNLIGGWAHSRDLLYVPSLFKAYNTEKKIYETLILAEKAGINTINTGFPTNALISKYKRMTGSKIKVISQVVQTWIIMITMNSLIRPLIFELKPFRFRVIGATGW